MQAQFSFKGRHLRDLGLEASVKTKSRPVLPEAKNRDLEVPFADGCYDFTDHNPRGRPLYKERAFVLQISVKSNPNRLMTDITKIANWLHGRGELIFDDMPDVIWDAAIWGGVNFEPLVWGRKAVLEVTFRVKPFSRYPYHMQHTIRLGDPIRLGRRIPLGAFAGFFSFSQTEQEGRFMIKNIGSVPTAPRIMIDCPTGTDEIYIFLEGETKIELMRKHTTHIVIDHEKMMITDGQKNILDECTLLTEDFFELAPGDNEVTIRIDKATAWTVKFDFTPRYFFNTLDWRDPIC